MATGKGAKVAVVVGLAPLLFGAYQVHDAVYEWYRVNDMPAVIAIFGAGVLLVAFGLGKLKGPVVGGALLVAGGAYVVASLKLGKTHDAERMRGYEGDVALASAAAAVCKGTPNAAASGALVDGKRPVMLAMRRSDQGDDGWFGQPWEGLLAPRTQAELALVACRVESKDYRDHCEYHGKDDAAGSYTISFYKLTDVISVTDAKTGKVLDMKTFEGADPSTSCDTEIKVDPHETSHDVTGASPNRDDEIAYVRQFVDARKP